MTDSSQLERGLRRTQLALGFLVLLNLALLALLWLPTRTLRVHRLLLLDAQGRERGALQLGATGPELSLRDAAGHGRVYLGAPNEDAVFQLCDESGKPRFSASLEAESCGLGILDERHALRAEFRLTKDKPAIFMRDRKETIRLGLGVGNDGPGFYLSDVSGRSRAELCVLGNDVVRLLFRDERERRRILIAQAKKEGTVMEQLDPSGHPR